MGRGVGGGFIFVWGGGGWLMIDGGSSVGDSVKGDIGEDLRLKGCENIIKYYFVEIDAVMIGGGLSK